MGKIPFYLKEYVSHSIAIFSSFKDNFYKEIKRNISKKFSTPVYIAEEISDLGLFKRKTIKRFYPVYSPKTDSEKLDFFIYQFNKHTTKNDLYEYLDPSFYDYLERTKQINYFHPINKNLISLYKSYYLVFNSTIKIFHLTQNSSPGPILDSYDIIDQHFYENRQTNDFVILIIQMQSIDGLKKFDYDKESLDFSDFKHSELLFGEIEKLLRLNNKINFPIVYSNRKEDKDEVFKKLYSNLINLHFQLNLMENIKN